LTPFVVGAYLFLGQGGAPGKGAAVEGVDVVVECVLDESAMVVPPHWRSRIPFQFAPVTTAAAATSAADGADGGSAAGENGPQGGLTAEDKTAWLLPSLRPAAASARFQWTLDVLAGTVISAAHDTYDLERRLKMKNAWEEAVPGRAARASAAVSYAVAKRAVRSNDTAMLGLFGAAEGGAGGAGGAGSPSGSTPAAASKEGSPMGPSAHTTAPATSRGSADLLAEILAEALEKEVCTRSRILLSLPVYGSFLTTSLLPAPCSLLPALPPHRHVTGEDGLVRT